MASSSVVPRGRLCPFPACTRERYVSNGIVHGFCGRTHARLAAEAGQIDGVEAPHGLCHVCKLTGCNESVFYEEETDRVHDFCCKSHHILAVRRGEWSSFPDRVGPNDSINGRVCSLPGCNRGVAVGENGRLHDFCGRTHAKKAEAQGLGVVTEPFVERVFVGPRSSWKLQLLMKTHPEYEGIKAQFTDGWRKPGSRPRVERIFKVLMEDSLHAAHLQYREEVAGKVGSGDPNIRRRFHGTQSECGVGTHPGMTPCGSSTCSVCEILTHGFKCARAGSGAVGGQVRVLRYGRGIYSSGTSGKANDYAVGSEKSHAGKIYRSQFLCHVVAGRVYKTQLGDLNLSSYPPSDSRGVPFDSVVGEPGGDLNYDELVVYDDRAVLPAYFVIYSL